MLRAVSSNTLPRPITAYNLAESRYRVGGSSIVELSQAQLNKTAAEIAPARTHQKNRENLQVLRDRSGPTSDRRWPKTQGALDHSGANAEAHMTSTNKFLLLLHSIFSVRD